MRCQPAMIQFSSRRPLMCLERQASRQSQLYFLRRAIEPVASAAAQYESHQQNGPFSDGIRNRPCCLDRKASASREQVRDHPIDELPIPYSIFTGIAAYLPPSRSASTMTPALVQVQYRLPLGATVMSVGSGSPKSTTLVDIVSRLSSLTLFRPPIEPGTPGVGTSVEWAVV